MTKKETSKRLLHWLWPVLQVKLYPRISPGSRSHDGPLGPRRPIKTEPCSPSSLLRDLAPGPLGHQGRGAGVEGKRESSSPEGARARPLPRSGLSAVGWAPGTEMIRSSFPEEEAMAGRGC